MSESEFDILGLFPSFDSERFGGVQASGREAWHGIVNHLGEQRTSAQYYEAGASKVGAVLTAMKNRNTAKIVLVWHLQLLKLVPFLNHSSSRVILFLHGIEAWLKHDPLTQLILRKVHLILSNSDYTWSRFLACNPAFRDMPHQTVHLGSGACLGSVSPPPPSQPPAILMVGRLNKAEDYKGHRQMIKAWPLVLGRVPDARLWIVGDGDLRATLERMAGENVQFFGHASDDEKEQLIAQCRCLALPSAGEGFGLVYLEAMRRGRPCLVSTLDAGREVVNPPEAGLAVDPGDPRSIADAVHRLLTMGTEWDEWSMRARSRYESCFTGAQFQQRLVTALFTHAG